MSYEHRCQQCARQGDLVRLDRDPSGNWACPRCGMIDQRVTDQVNFVEYSANIGSIVDTEQREFDRQGYDRVREKFNEGVLTLINLYLGIPSPATSIIETPSANIRNGARQWLERILESERRMLERLHKTSNPTTRKMRYYAAVAIKFAAQESCLIALDHKLEAAGIRRSKRNLPMFTKGDDTAQNPPLWDMFGRANSFTEDSFGHMDSLEFLRMTYRKLSRMVSFVVPPADALLLHVIQVIHRIQYIISRPPHLRQSVLITRSRIGKGDRIWDPEDFSYFEDLDWRQVLPNAYRLYQMQETVRLWGNLTSPVIGVALALWAMQASCGAVLPQYSSWQRELSAIYNRQQWVAAEKFRELRNMLIAWSTSIGDAGLPFPALPLPPKGTFGDGVSGYSSDRRRPIPEIDIAAAVAPIIVANWPAIMKARLKYRFHVMSEEDELWLARKMCVVSGGLYHVQMVKARASGRAEDQPRTGTGRRPTTRLFKALAEEARVAISNFEPLRRARTRPLRDLYDGSRETSPAPSAASMTSSPGRQAVLASQPPVIPFVPPPPEKTIEELIALPDPSSDEGGDEDSEDEDARPATSLADIHRQSRRSGEVHAPFAFTIGPQGFNTEKGTGTGQATPVITPHLHSSASEHSQSSVLVPRGQSYSSQSSAGSASEAETVVYGGPRSVPMSASTTRTMSSIGSFVREDIQEEASHVGQLVRERASYAIVRPALYYLTGEVVLPPVEAAMWSWVHTQIRNGSMPREITPAYLLSIGINGNPRRLDLGKWVRMNALEWSPVECLLRAGIKPREIPVQHIPHSVAHLRLMLYHYRDSTLLAPIGQKIDDAQLDKEMEWLFSAEGGDDLKEVFVSDYDAGRRKERYIRSGVWADEVDEVKPPIEGGRTGITPSEEAKFAFEEEDEDWDEGELEAYTDDRASSLPRSQYEAKPRAAQGIRRELGRIRHSVQMAAARRRDGLAGLMYVLKAGDTDAEQEGADLVENADWTDEVMGLLDFGDMGLDQEVGGPEGEADDREEGDEEKAAIVGGGRKRKQPGSSGRSAKRSRASAVVPVADQGPNEFIEDITEVIPKVRKRAKPVRGAPFTGGTSTDAITAHVVMGPPTLGTGPSASET
ncbi:hypothetical protein IAU60_002622 [Kwoniella sp. DSM 27419]